MRHPTIHACSFGLGASTEPPTVRVTWPSGATEEWHDVGIDRYTTLTEGTGG